MLKLNVGFTKKVGEANYGSRGAAVNLEIELDSGLVGDADRLKERIRQLFGLAKEAVDEELAVGAAQLVLNGHSDADQNSSGRLASPSNNSRRRDGTRWATASQVRALNAIADRRKLDLASLLAERFQIHDPTALTITEASSLIDELKGQAAGTDNGGRR